MLSTTSAEISMSSTLNSCDAETFIIKCQDLRIEISKELKVLQNLDSSLSNEDNLDATLECDIKVDSTLGSNSNVGSSAATNLNDKAELPTLDTLDPNELSLDSTLKCIASNWIIPLLLRAQLPIRNQLFRPLDDTPHDVLKCADFALLLLGEICSVAVLVLQMYGWEVAEDEDGQTLFHCVETDAVQRQVPDVIVGDDDDENIWTRRLLLEIPILVAPYLVDGETRKVVWPVTVVSCENNVTVIDVREEDGIMRQMVLGVWKGLAGFRESEMDKSWPLGSHLENWYTCTLAGIALLSAQQSKKGIEGLTLANPQILVVGLGGGSLPAFLQLHAPNMAITCVEISYDVVIAAQKYFELDAFISSSPNTAPGSGEIHVQISDIFKFAQENTNRYDVILLDVYTNGSFPSSLLTLTFFKSLHSLLVDSNGVIGLNTGIGETAEMLETIMNQIYPTTTCHDSKIKGIDENIVLFGGKVDISLESWRRILAEALSDATAMPFKLEVCRLKRDQLTIGWGFYDKTEEEEERCAEKVEDNIPTLVQASLVADADPWALFD